METGKTPTGGVKKMTRKSTPKYKIVTTWDGTLIYGPCSKTECKIISAGMGKSVRIVRA
jgi:hypothetical protein